MNLHVHTTYMNHMKDHHFSITPSFNPLGRKSPLFSFETERRYMAAYGPLIVLLVILILLLLSANPRRGGHMSPKWWWILVLGLVINGSNCLIMVNTCY